MRTGGGAPAPTLARSHETPVPPTTTTILPARPRPYCAACLTAEPVCLLCRAGSAVPFNTLYPPSLTHACTHKQESRSVLASLPIIVQEFHRHGLFLWTW